MRDVNLPREFLEHGGTEVAPMSTTSDLSVAVRYSLSANSVLLRLETDSFITRGADVSYVSAFPSENEYLYPPLVYLKLSGDPPVKLRVGGHQFAVLNVVPY